MEISLSLGPDPALGHASAYNLPHARRSCTLQDTLSCEGSVFLVRRQLSNLNALADANNQPGWLVWPFTGSPQFIRCIYACPYIGHTRQVVIPEFCPPKKSEIVLSCTARTTPWCIFMAYTLKKNKERAMRAETGRTLNFLGTESHERDADHHWGMGAYR